MQKKPEPWVESQMDKEALSMKTEFGDKYIIRLDESYQHENPEKRDLIEWYYVAPAKYGEFYLQGGDTMAFQCTANRVKERIMREFRGKITIHLECQDESILLFDRNLFLKIAPIARPKKRPGRKQLSEIERKRFVEAGRAYRFTGKSA